MKLYTTFALAKAGGACADSYKRQAKRLGGISHYGKDTPIYLSDLAKDSLSDAVWCLGAVPAEQAEARDKLARLYACDCAERVLPLFEARYPDDKRPREAIEVSRRYAYGTATLDELRAAAGAAWAEAAGVAAGVALQAAEGAAWVAGDEEHWLQQHFIELFKEDA